MTFQNLKNNPLFLVIFFLGIVVGLFFHKINVFKEKQPSNISLQRLHPSGGYLVNPLIGVETLQGNDVKLESTKYSIESYVKGRIEDGDVTSIAVYIRDLNKGSWVGINEDLKFAAASFIKVPLLIAYLKQAEEDPALLTKEIKYETPINTLPQNIPPEHSAQLGNAYTVDELLRYMIVYSDNVSAELLLKNTDLKLINDLYSELQLAAPNFPGSESMVSAEEYATFFRILYNVTYLNRDFSEKAMKLLVETDFHDGIAAGLPPELTVAHKFAERAYSIGGAQLHDCGIVYYPENPYLICVMTKGLNLNTLNDIIKDISRITYEHRKQKMDFF